MKKSVGYNIEGMPSKDCGDKKCPYHGDVSVRGRMLQGKVISDAMDNSVKVMWERSVRIAKYNRYLKKRSVVFAHNPSCLDAEKGDTVLIGETRPLSKAKNFVVLKVMKNERNQS